MSMVFGKSGLFEGEQCGKRAPPAALPNAPKAPPGILGRGGGLALAFVHGDKAGGGHFISSEKRKRMPYLPPTQMLHMLHT